MKKIVVFIIVIFMVFTCTVNAFSTRELSVNNAKKYEYSSFGLGHVSVNSLASSESYLYAGVGIKGLFRRNIIEQNTEWEYLGFEGEFVRSVYVDPAFPDIVYVGIAAEDFIDENGEPHSMYKSNDGGISWTPCDDDLQFDTEWGPFRIPVRCIEGIPGDVSTLYVGGSFQILKSVDGGVSWDLIWGMNFVPGFVNDIAVNPSNPQEIWAGGEGSCYQPFVTKSIDGGQTWNGVSLPELQYQECACKIIVFNPNNTQIVYLGMEGSVIRTTDSGESCYHVLQPPEYPYFYAVALDPLNPEHIFAGGHRGGSSPITKIWEETFDDDFTGSWNWTNWSYYIEPQGGRGIYTYLFDINNPNILYVGTRSGVFTFQKL
jgi:hypothetical protein